MIDMYSETAATLAEPYIDKQECRHMKTKFHPWNQSGNRAIHLARFFLLALLEAVVAESNWEFSKIDECPLEANYMRSGICLDSNGDPHVMCQADWQRGHELNYGTFENGSWKLQKIQTECSVFSMYFTLDATNTPHVLYSGFNCKEKGLKYAFLKDGAWKSSVIYSKSHDEAEMMRRFGTSFPLDLMVNSSNHLFTGLKNTVHLLYVDPETEKLMHGHRDQDQEIFGWDSLESVGHYRFSTSRNWPFGYMDPEERLWILYKKFSGQVKGEKVVEHKLELRLYHKTHQEANVITLEFPINPISRLKILPNGANKPLIAYTIGAGRTLSDDAERWLVVQHDGKKWEEIYRGEPREDLLAAQWVDGRLHLLVTRFRSDQPYAKGMIKDLVVRVTLEPNWRWKSEELIMLNLRRTVAGVLNKAGDAYVLFATSSEKSSRLELGVKKYSR